MISNTMLRELFPKGEFGVGDIYKKKLTDTLATLRILQDVYNPVLENITKVGETLDGIFSGEADSYTQACKFNEADRSVAMNAMRLSEVLYRLSAMIEKASSESSAEVLIGVLRPMYLPAIGAMMLESVVNSIISDAIKARYSELKDIQPEMLLEWKLDGSDIQSPKVIIVSYRDEAIAAMKKEEDGSSEA